MIFCLFPLFFSYTGQIEVKVIPDAIELICKSGTISKPNTDKEASPLKLDYNDENSGEYKCTDNEMILVKFRSKFCINTLSSIM